MKKKKNKKNCEIWFLYSKQGAAYEMSEGKNVVDISRTFQD